MQATEIWPGHTEVPGRCHELVVTPTCVAVDVSKILSSMSVGVQNADCSVGPGVFFQGNRVTKGAKQGGCVKE